MTASTSNRRTARRRTLAVMAVLALGHAARADDSQASVAAEAGTLVLKVQALGAQIYECKAEAGGALSWSFREPIATLIADGKTIGRHFAGPTWAMADGSFVVGTVAAKAPGTSAADIPWLKLDVTTRGGDGLLKDVVIVQRIATRGGVKGGPCPSAGALLAEPYAADYLFSKPQ